MKLEKINDNKLQLKINKDELKKQNISINDIESGKPNVEKFFYSILEKSIYSEDFLCGNAYLYIEITTKSFNDFTVNITKISENNKSSNGLFDKAKSKFYSVSSTAYLFENIQDLLLFSDYVQKNGLFVGKNSLYSYNGKPLIIFGKSTIKNPEFIKTFLVINEFCVLYFSKPLEISALLENSNILAINSAIQNINNYILA